jgi:hypothetical protein
MGKLQKCVKTCPKCLAEYNHNLKIPVESIRDYFWSDRKFISVNVQYPQSTLDKCVECGVFFNSIEAVVQNNNEYSDLDLPTLNKLNITDYIEALTVIEFDKLYYREFQIRSELLWLFNDLRRNNVTNELNVEWENDFIDNANMLNRLCGNETGGHEMYIETLRYLGLYEECHKFILTLKRKYENSSIYIERRTVENCLPYLPYVELESCALFIIEDFRNF